MKQKPIEIIKNVQKDISLSYNAHKGILEDPNWCNLSRRDGMTKKSIDTFISKWLRECTRMLRRIK